jgi:hypothetical protein
MTEEEAKTKWCPFARVQIDEDDGSGAPNRFVEDKDGKPDSDMRHNSCIGSACMAWRWIPEGVGIKVDHGFCGLAGKP